MVRKPEAWPLAHRIRDALAARGQRERKREVNGQVHVHRLFEDRAHSLDGSHERSRGRHDPRESTFRIMQPPATDARAPVCLAHLCSPWLRMPGLHLGCETDPPGCFGRAGLSRRLARTSSRSRRVTRRCSYEQPWKNIPNVTLACTASA